MFRNSWLLLQLVLQESFRIPLHLSKHFIRVRLVLQGESATKQVIPHLQCIPLQADDDTYVIVEHLKAYLSKLNPDEPHYLGYVLKPYLVRQVAYTRNKRDFTSWLQKNGYNSGGAGYVLSNAALKLFDSLLYDNETLCPDNIYEDVGIGACLANIGIFPGDTRNAKGQNRFNTDPPSEIFYRNINASWKFYPEKPVCSEFLSLIDFSKKNSHPRGGCRGSKMFEFGEVWSLTFDVDEL